MIAVFPNYAAQRDNGSILLEASHALLVDALTSDLPTVAVAAPIDLSNRKSAYRRLTNERVRFIALGHVRSTGSRVGKLLAYVRMQFAIFRVVRRTSFSYIYLPGNVGLGACLQCLLLGRPYGVYLRGVWVDATPRPFQWIHPIVFRNAKFVLCTGVRLTQETSELNPRCETVVPMSPLLLREPGPLGRAERGPPLRVLYVGELIRTKGTYELLDGMAIVQSGEPNGVTLSMVGSGPEREGLEEHAAKLGLASSVHFVGFVDDPDRMAELYSSHDVLCLPTYTEGFPRVLYEAMAFGLPVITTRVGQIDTVVSENGNGLFVEVRSVQDIAERISALIKNPDLRRRLGKGARETMQPMLEQWKGSTHGRQVVRWLRRSGVGECAT